MLNFSNNVTSSEFEERKFCIEMFQTAPLIISKTNALFRFFPFARSLTTSKEIEKSQVLLNSEQPYAVFPFMIK